MFRTLCLNVNGIFYFPTDAAVPVGSEAGDMMVVEEAPLEGTYCSSNCKMHSAALLLENSLLYLSTAVIVRQETLIQHNAHVNFFNLLNYIAPHCTPLITITGRLDSLSLSEEVRNQETLKNQQKYERRAARANDSATAASAARAGDGSGVGDGSGAGGVDGDSEGLSEGDVVVEMAGVSAGKAGKGEHLM